MLLRELLQLPPAAALLPGPAASAAQEEAVPAIPEGQPFLPLVHVHAAHRRGVFQGQDIGAVLIELEEIGPVLVEYREVCGDDNFFRRHRSVVCHRRAGAQLQDLGALEDPQSFRDGGGEFQRVELGLLRKLHRPRRGHGQGRGLDVLRRETQAGQGLQLPVQLPPVRQGVDAGVPLLKITVDAPAELPVLPQGPPVGLQVQPGFFRAEFPEKFAVNQAVLERELGGGVPRRAAAEAVRLHQGAVHPRPVQPIGAQQSRQAAADHQHVRLQVSVQGSKLGRLRRPGPNGIHAITSALA